MNDFLDGNGMSGDRCEAVLPGTQAICTPSLEQQERVWRGHGDGLRRNEKIAYAVLAVALCILVTEIALFWMNGSFDRAAANMERNLEVAQSEQLFAQHRGEPSGHAIGEEEGLAFSYGLAIAQRSDDVDDDTLVPYANSQLSYVPDYIKQKFLDDGWTLEITTDDLTERYVSQESDMQVYTVEPGEVIMGLTSPADKTIYIDDSPYSVQQAAVHEMGHYVDYVLGYPSYSDIFQTSVDKDRTVYGFYFPYSHLDDNEELFAEAFQAYWKHPDELRMFCPNMYAYFESRF